MAQSERKHNLLDILAATKGYDMAFLTSFNFELPFFERAILSRLFSSEVRKISLFVDSEQFTQAISEVSECAVGRKYMVSPVHMNSSFHPKLILLLGERAARLVIGSANITTSGYARNNEVFNYIDYSADHPEYLDVICAAIDFVEQIHNISYGLDSAMIVEAKEKIYYHSSRENESVRLLHNLSRSILSQWAEQIPVPVNEIRIAVPYYDKELSALRQVRQTFPDCAVSLYIQNEKSSFPVYLNKDESLHIYPFDGFKTGSQGSGLNFHHGKVFLAKTAVKDYVLYGSANCTQAAMTVSFADGGNVECDFLEIGDSGAFDAFFDQIHIQENTQLTSQLMSFTADPGCNYFFKYGEEKDGIELHFGYSHASTDVKFILDEIELSWKDDQENHECIAWIPEDWAYGAGDIFQVIIVYGGKQETVRCWSFNKTILENNRRNPGSSNNLTQFELESEGSKYIEDRILIFNASATCYADLEEEKKTLAYFQQIKAEKEEGEEDEDFVLDIEIPDEYRIAYRQYKIADGIRNMFIDRVIHASGPWFPEEKEDDEPSGDKIVTLGMNTGIPRKATSAEKSFEYFVKRHVKGMQGKRFIEEVSFEHHWGMTEVVLDILSRYHDKLHVEDIFQTDYVIRVRSELYAGLLKKMEKQVLEEDRKNALLIRCYELLVRDYVLREKEPVREIQYEYDKWNKALLLAIDRVFMIRNTYPAQLSVLKKQKYYPMDPQSIAKYIENLFGYKNYQQLTQYIREYYPGADVYLSGNTIFIRTELSDVLSSARPVASVLNEITKYSRNEPGVERVEIIQEKKEINTKNTIVQIHHRVGLNYHNWTVIKHWSNGLVREGKSEYLPF